MGFHVLRAIVFVIVLLLWYYIYFQFKFYFYVAFLQSDTISVLNTAAVLSCLRLFDIGDVFPNVTLWDMMSDTVETGCGFIVLSV